MEISTKLDQFISCTFKIQAMVTILIVISSSSSAQNMFPYGLHVGDAILTDLDFDKGYITVNLNQSISVYGRATFDKVYINTIGAVTFGENLETDQPDEVKNDIIAFAPFLISTVKKKFTRRRIFFRVSRNIPEFDDIQQVFRSNIADALYTPSLAMIVTFDYSVSNNKTNKQSEVQNNNYQLMLVSDGDKTYIRYFFKNLEYIQNEEKYAKVGQFALAESALMCANHVEGSGTKEVSNLSKRSNTGSPGNFYWRVDLPLRCSGFESDCGVAEEPADTFNLCPIGFFFETISLHSWTFYRLYFCKAGTTKTNGAVSIRQGCSYDSDYYVYEWRNLGPSDQCIETITDFWEKFFMSA